jgi:hypothetical protein
VPNSLRAVRVIALAALGRRDEALTDLATLRRELAGMASPDADELQLLHEAERALAR